MIAKSFYFSNAPKYKLGKVINAREISGLGLDFVKILVLSWSQMSDQPTGLFLKRNENFYIQFIPKH